MTNRFKLKKPEMDLNHTVLKCETCHQEFEYYLTAIQEAHKHVRETGHTVSGETGYYYKIEAVK